MVVSDVLLVYPGKGRGIRSAHKPVFAVPFDRCSQSESIFLCIGDISLCFTSSVEPVWRFLKEGVIHIWFKMEIALSKLWKVWNVNLKMKRPLVVISVLVSEQVTPVVNATQKES